MNPDPFRVQEPKSRRFRLAREKHQWVEGNFVAPDITDEHAILYSQTDGYIGTVLNRRSIIRLAFAFALGFAAILSRAGWIQIVQGADFSKQSDDNRLRYEQIYADRGLIYDRYQKPLVRNIPNYTVYIRPKLLPQDARQRHKLLSDLYQEHLLAYVTQTQEQFLEKIEKARKDRFSYDKDMIVADSLPQDQAIMLQIATKDLAAVTVKAISRREYLNEAPVIGTDDDTKVYPPVKSLSHVLGYMTRLQPGEYEQVRNQGYLYNDTIGRTGLESTYEQALRGAYGWKEIEVDAQGRFKQILHQQAPQDGKNLLTSLDLELQRNLETFIRERLQQAKKSVAAAIVMNPNTGEILALVNVPTYDGNWFSYGLSEQQSQELFQNEDRPLFNRAVSGEYPSGSIFKPIVAAAALQAGIISDRTTFISTGGIRINDFFFPDWKAGGHGATNIYKAIAESVNTYFYIIGGGYQDREGLGVQEITEYAKVFGLSSVTGIDLPGETAGFLPSKEWKEEVKKERWYIGDTYHLAIGQGDLLVTPIQMAAVISAFANGGTLYQPHIVTGISDGNERLEQNIKSHVLRDRVADPEVLSIVETGLRRVVTQGSGRRLNDLPFSVSGKTGTAQWHSEKEPHAWFVGYAPSKQPSMAFVILVEQGGEGSDLPVTIAHDLLSWWAENRI